MTSRPFLSPSNVRLSNTEKVEGVVCVVIESQMLEIIYLLIVITMRRNKRTLLNQFTSLVFVGRFQIPEDQINTLTLLPAVTSPKLHLVCLAQTQRTHTGRDPKLYQALSK